MGTVGDGGGEEVSEDDDDEKVRMHLAWLLVVPITHSDCVRYRRWRFSDGPMTLRSTGKKMRLCSVPNAIMPRYIRK